LNECQDFDQRFRADRKRIEIVAINDTRNFRLLCHDAITPQVLGLLADTIRKQPGPAADSTIQRCSDYDGEARKASVPETGWRQQASARRKENSVNYSVEYQNSRLPPISWPDGLHREGTVRRKQFRASSSPARHDIGALAAW